MNIHVSNLGLEVSDAELKTLFAQHGEVGSAEIMMDGFTGKSRGFAFVEMPNDAEAEAAISNLHKSKFNEQVLTVQAAKPRREQKGSYPVGRKFQGEAFRKR